jgi:transposase
VAKVVGTRNFSHVEGLSLAALAAQGLNKAEAAWALGRSIRTVQRQSVKLRIPFAQRRAKPKALKPTRRPGYVEALAQRRELEDRVIQELALNGWSEGLAAIELDLDFSALSRHSKRLGITWTRYPNRSMPGAPVPALAELRRLQARVRRLRLRRG